MPLSSMGTPDSYMVLWSCSLSWWGLQMACSTLCDFCLWCVHTVLFDVTSGSIALMVFCSWWTGPDVFWKGWGLALWDALQGLGVSLAGWLGWGQSGTVLGLSDEVTQRWGILGLITELVRLYTLNILCTGCSLRWALCAALCWVNAVYSGLLAMFILLIKLLKWLLLSKRTHQPNSLQFLVFVD